jgi:predicted nucleotidyltransferase
MNGSVKNLLGELKSELQSLYGRRLRGLYLFGSYARNAADTESDVDVLIILEGMEHFGIEIERTSELASRLSLKHGVTISRVFVAEREWQEGDSPFLNRVRAEAIPA